jgi:hypothetical protein
MATEDLYSEFEREMWRLYEEPKAKYGYNATFYRRMLEQHGALATARRLAGDPKHHQGLTRLWELKALDLSVEALILREPWRQLFDAEVQSAARAKLGYGNDP